MTTNVIDRKAHVIASDSRWSYIENGYLIYVDDVGFDKIVWRPSGAMICAGDGLLIDAWQGWFRSAKPHEIAMPDTERTLPDGKKTRIDVMLLNAGSGQIRFVDGWYLSLDDHAHFCGTGAEYAQKCFAKNRCAKTSVGSASKDDYQTGGATKYAELLTGRHNLTAAPKTLMDAETELKKRGYAMNLTDKNVISFAEYVAGPGAAQGPSATGASNLSAPTGQPFRPWTSEAKDRLREAVREMVESERQDDTV